MRRTLIPLVLLVLLVTAGVPSSAAPTCREAGVNDDPEVRACRDPPMEEADDRTVLETHLHAGSTDAEASAGSWPTSSARETALVATLQLDAGPAGSHDAHAVVRCTHAGNLTHDGGGDPAPANATCDPAVARGEVRTVPGPTREAGADLRARPGLAEACVQGSDIERTCETPTDPSDPTWNLLP